MFKTRIKERGRGMSVYKKSIIESRHYSLPMDFPILVLDGEKWRISDVKSERLHFHNCLEIGIFHSDSGKIEFKDEALTFKAGDITCIPRYIPHTTYSTPNTESLWSYIFVDPEDLYLNLYDTSKHNIESPILMFENFQYLFSKKNILKYIF